MKCSEMIQALKLENSDQIIFHSTKIKFTSWRDFGTHGFKRSWNLWFNLLNQVLISRLLTFLEAIVENKLSWNCKGTDFLRNKSICESVSCTIWIYIILANIYLLFDINKLRQPCVRVSLLIFQEISYNLLLYIYGVACYFIECQKKQNMGN